MGSEIKVFELKGWAPLKEAAAISGIPRSTLYMAYYRGEYNGKKLSGFKKIGRLLLIHDKTLATIKQTYCPGFHSNRGKKYKKHKRPNAIKHPRKPKKSSEN